MKITLYKSKIKSKKCLVLIGGSGDSTKKFIPLVKSLNEKLKNFSICTFTFTTKSRTENIFELQSCRLLS